MEDRTGGGVRYRSFRIDGSLGEIPGGLWTPEDSTAGLEAPLPLVLIGHGASGSKQQDYVRYLARHFVLAHNIAAAAIDGPVHGDRRPDGGTDGRLQFLDFVQAWSTDTALTDKMVTDWRETLDALSLLDDGQLGGPVGYWGVSMGTILGLPFVAAEPRMRAAVLGLMGLTGPTSQRIASDAPKVACPVLFTVQWSDELFPRESAFALFEALGTKDKRLHANTGGHGAMPAEELRASCDFLSARLRPTE